MILNFVRLQTGLGQSANIANFAGPGTGGATVIKHHVGFPARRIKREDFDQRLKEQRDNTFGRRWFHEFKELEAAELAASALSLEANNKTQRKARENAAQVTREAMRAADTAEVTPETNALTLALQAAVGAGSIKESLTAAKRPTEYAIAMKVAIRQAEDDAEEEAEAIELLSLF